MDQVLGSRGPVLTYTGGPQHHRYQGRTQVRPLGRKYSSSSDGIRPRYLNAIRLLYGNLERVMSNSQLNSVNSDHAIIWKISMYF